MRGMAGPPVSIKVGIAWPSAVHFLPDKAGLHSMRPWERLITTWLAAGDGLLVAAELVMDVAEAWPCLVPQNITQV